MGNIGPGFRWVDKRKRWRDLFIVAFERKRKREREREHRVCLLFNKHLHELAQKLLAHVPNAPTFISLINSHINIRSV